VALVHFTKVFACKDARIYPLTADTGGAPTYGTGVDVPGVKSLEISGDIDKKELRGDNTLLDVFSVLKNVNGKLGHAKLSLDMLATMLGSAVVDSGTTPNQKATWSLTSASAPKYWKVEAATPTDGVDFVGGDLHVLFFKAVLSSFPGMGLAEEDYQVPGIEFGTVSAISNGKWMDVVANETAVAIP
jgi:hypothetical protein